MSRSTLLPGYQRDWPGYFRAVAGLPARETCVRALDAFESQDLRCSTAPVQRLALDLACGEGRDTREMLGRVGPTRWRVIATDSADAIAALMGTVPASDKARLTTHVRTMEELARGPTLAAALGLAPSDSGLDCVNASFALPFCHEDSFPLLWKLLVASLSPGGRFAGQIFGDRDEWAAVNSRRHFTREQTLGLLRGFEVEHFEEADKDGTDAMGGVKRHHIFHIVARRNAL